MRKKTIISLLLGIVLTMSCFAVACGGKKPKVNLVDFTNVTETVGLGENYVLPNGVVFDADGNDYRVIYEVKDSAGEKVSVLNGRFKVNLIGNAKYFITCYAEITEDYNITRTITLNVIDRTAPVITANNLPFAYVGQEYEIVNVEVTDNSGETVTPVYSVKDVNGEDVTITDGKFTPTVAGIYTLTINATDSEGNASEETANIYVRQYMGAYVVENFNDEYGLPVFSVFDAGYTDKPIVYHETFEGRTGVAEGKSTNADSKSGGPHWYFKFDSSFKKVHFDYVYIKAYIKCTTADRPSVEIFSQNRALNGGVPVPVNEWVEIRITKEDIMATGLYAESFFDASKEQGETALDCFYRKMTEGNGAYLFWFRNKYGPNLSLIDVPSSYTLYVDEIGYKPRFNPTVELQETYELGETITLNPSVTTHETDYTITTLVTDPSGNSVTLTDNQFRITETGEYTVEFTYNSTNGYNGYSKFTFESISNKEIVVEEYTGSPTQNDTITLPLGTIDGGEVTCSVSIGGHSVTVTNNQFVAKVAGDFVVTYSSVIDGLTYSKSITITVSELPLEKNTVNTLSSPSSVTDYTEELNSTITWLTDYQGKTGVAKFDAAGNWSYFGFKPMQDMSNYQGAKYLVIRMYVESCGDNVLWFGGLSDKCYTAVKVGEWVDYCFDGAYFLEKWSDSLTKYNVYSHGMSVKLAGVYYIDEIFVKYDCSALGLESTVNGTLFAGETLSVALNNPNNVDGVTMTVTDPLGNVVIDSSSFVAYPGVYKVTISKDGYEDYVETFVVARSVGENEVLDIVYASDITTYSSLRDNKGTVTYLPEYEGETGVVKFDIPSAWTYFEFKPVQDMSNFTGAKYLVIRMYIANGYAGKLWFGESSEQCSTAIKTGEWVDYYFNGEFFLNTWANSLTNFNYKHNLGASAAGTFYIDKIFVAYDCASLGLSATVSGDLFVDSTVSVTINDPNEVGGATVTVTAPDNSVVDNPSSFTGVKGLYTVTISKDGYLDNVTKFYVGRTAGETEVLNITSSQDIEEYTFERASNIEYVDSYQGETGVAKFTAPQNWSYFGFKPVRDMSKYAGAKYLVIRMYIESTTSDCTLWFADTSGKCTTSIQTGEWVDYYFDGAFFLEKWADCIENPADKHTIGVSRAGTIYISNIFVVYE